MAGKRDYCDMEALKRVLNGSWDGNAVQFLQKYEIERTAMSNPLLQRLEISDKSVILVQRYQSRKMSRSKSTSSSLFIDDTSDNECELELSGCPLEWPMEPQSFSLIESPSYEDSSKNSGSPCKSKLKALPADEGRTLLNAIVNMLQSYKTEMDPVWVACDGTDPQYTAYLGYFVEGVFGTNVTVSCRGPIESKEDLPSFGCIQRKHFWGLHQSHTHTITQVDAKYDVLRHYDPSQQSSREDIMVLECSWQKAAVLQQPPSADAACHLNVQILPGNERSPARSVYKEMRFVKKLVECLTSGAVAWAPDLNGPTLIDKVKTLLQGSRKGSYRGKSGTPFPDVGWNSSDFDLYIETVVMSKRQPVDFTDEMWNAMSGCGTYQELKEGFSMIFRAVQAGEIKPLIVPKNGTKVGAYLRNMSPHFRPECTMEGLMPVRMLTEIGLQKLQRDFVNIFVGLELASQEQLVPFLVCPTLTNEALGELWKLQAVLDMIMLCKTYLHLPIHYLSGYTREALKYFSNCERGKYIHKFRFPLKVPLVRVVLENVSPMEWTASIKSRQGTHTAHTIVHISTTAPFDHLLTEKQCTMPHHLRDSDYYCTIISSTQDKLRF
ncbi:protein zwilch homolog [Rhipicephalus sanguineus]|uniref:protein zwilch homolog n=1 Tax=Rhipicephalus sanguineus TaxID=34632 RepID=UPI001893FE04|nr:protein zwilch homolog [Rhipicephalus sanguineus]